MNVVHIAFECAPIYKTGGLGDVVGSLPKELSKLGVKSTIILPGYGWIKQVAVLPDSDIPVLYAQSPWFEKINIVHDPKIQAPKFAHFALQVLDLIKQKNLKPDIIHCHDWHTGLVPLLLKKQLDPYFSRTKTVLTIHNIAFQGNFPLRFLNHPQTQIYFELFNKNSKKISFLRAGIENADFITTVSPNHAREIKQGTVSFGLKQAIRQKQAKFVGILNGIDEDFWNPSKDQFLYKNYNRQSVILGKSVNKEKLQHDMGLVINRHIPLFGFVARLSSQKGVEFVISLMEKASQKRLEVLILGKGSKAIEKILKEFQSKITGSWVNVILGFDEKLAHRIYAGSDFFLISSRFEPCGLTQMISMRYGTIPIASAVGGLKDTIVDAKTGFLIAHLDDESFFKKIDEALTSFEKKEKHEVMVDRVMNEDFFWEKSAKEYLRVYNKVLQK